MTAMSITENIARIRERIAAAALRAGRDPAQVALMAVSKTRPADCIREAFEAGQRLFGENRVQEFQAKHAELSAASPTLPPQQAQSRLAGDPGVASAAVCNIFDIEAAEFHLIGHLQSNKAAKAAELFQAVDSLDSLRLAERLDAAAAKLGKTLRVLVEVNVGGEEAKSGLAADSPELLQILQAATRLRNLEFRGLMTVPPFTEDPEGARPCFRQLRELHDRLAEATGMALPELSMGMSHDFEIAVEEGSTCVRIGTAIFGERG
jgi:pyridoxal phosphate enzyme (YggS family)